MLGLVSGLRLVLVVAVTVPAMCRVIQNPQSVGSFSLEHSLVKLLKCCLLSIKEVGKAALEVGKNVAADTGKKVIERVMQPKAKNKIENILSNYTDQSMKGSTVVIQDLVKKTVY